MLERWTSKKGKADLVKDIEDFIPRIEKLQAQISKANQLLVNATRVLRWQRKQRDARKRKWKRAKRNLKAKL